MKREEIIASGGAHADAGIVIGSLGIIFAVLGVISDAMNITLGLESMSWFLLAIFVGLISISNYIAWAIAMHLDAIEARTKKEE